MTREKDIEAFMVSQIKKQGGLSFKWVSPGNSGVPDRIVILPEGIIWFVELKKEGEKLRKLQRWQTQMLKAMGCNVITFDSKESVSQWIKEVMHNGVHSAQVSAKGD